ncbi:exosome complex RNA-binding protein Rrp4 [Methanolobus vulcani]|uniref:Exosome complex component Rrp4 n=1 Tax=Methanolobus vulcani TaxID=38026 RepID=A0A7Z8KP89_9EURY|nr:exosome complex RNA-binding protein Rrp4 [Methanolobus vulcani]TQD26254.1 RNA-binding protein [Methanolobus vulcani]
MEREIVIPGQLLSENKADSGPGTYVKDGKVYSLLYGVKNAKKKISVIPFSGKYIPSARDYVIGTVIEVTPSNWIFNIGSPYDGLLHVSEYPRRVEQVMMAEYMGIGTPVLLRVKDVSSSMKVELTMRERGLRALSAGRVIEITPTKVPRIIGHGGSMVSMLKKETNCEIFVGQNGRIWIKGKDSEMDLLTEAIELIIKHSHTSGLTDRISLFLKGDEEHVSEKDETVLEEDLTEDTKDSEDESEIREDTYRKVDALLEDDD